jgi:hypothetical protein
MTRPAQTVSSWTVDAIFGGVGNDMVGTKCNSRHTHSAATACRCTLDKDPSKRPSAKQLLDHPWIRKFMAQAAQGVQFDAKPPRALLCKAELRQQPRRRSDHACFMRDGNGRRPVQRRRKSAKGIAIAAETGARKSTQQRLSEVPRGAANDKPTLVRAIRHPAPPQR